jgi:hypothetical protein
MTAARRSRKGSERKSQMPAESLESFCGRRAAFLAGEIKRNTCASLSLRLDDGMADDACKDQRRCVKRQVPVPDDRDDCGVGGTMLLDGRECRAGGFGGPHRSSAVMCTAPSAAGREIHVGGGREGENRRDQRKAEEEQQNETESAPHSAIVVGFVSEVVREISADGSWHQPEL